MKKGLSLVLVLMLMFSLSLTAFAANDQSIVIDHEHAGHTYEAYQIFTGEFSADGVLANITWGTGIQNETALQAAVAAAFERTPAEVSSAATVAALLSHDTATSDTPEVKKFASILATKESGALKFLSSVKATATWDASTGKYTVANLHPGYYLIKDAENTQTGQNEAATYFMLKVTHGTAVVNPKTGVPSVEKKVDDVNDSRTDIGHSTQMDSADHDIGDLVHFTVTATLPTDGMEYFQEYKLSFVDDMHQALKLVPSSIKVYLNTVDDANDITSHFALPTAPAQHFEVSCANVKDIPGAGNQRKLILVYDAELTADGVVYGNPGNPNTISLKYSNNPNYSGSGDPATGTTPPDEVVVFTYYVKIDKTSGGSGDALAGANFKLEKKIVSGATTDWEEVVFPNGEGKYYSYELTTGDHTYVVTMNNEGTVTSVKEGATELDAAAIAAMSLPTGAEGIAKATSFYFRGLDAGEYRLTETATPAGYNTLAAPVEFDIVANHQLTADHPVLTELKSTSNPEFHGAVANGSVDSTIMNTRGSVLPSTGGMGTTVLYVLGTIMVLGSAVLLITKKRMGEKG